MCIKMIPCILLIVLVNNAASYSSAFDRELYERVLDPDLCDRQLTFLSNDSLGLKFIDFGAKLPSGIMVGNMADLGYYSECLDLVEVREDMVFEGKYSIIRVPLEQNPVTLPTVSGTGDEQRYASLRKGVMGFTGLRSLSENRVQNRALPGGSPMEAALTLAVCIPKVCPVRQAVDFVQDRMVFANLTYREDYSRLKNDKPVVAADYVAMVLFVIIILTTMVSTMYDLHYAFVLKEEASPLLRSFSVYTNTRRFLSFSSSPGSLDCIDGIRSISMMWVVVGHVYAFSYAGSIKNPLDVLQWLQSWSSVWITSAPITVDTFFLLSGILCVYVTIGKVSRGTFIRNIHMFYLNRLLRMFPLLAAVVLIQSSWVNHLSDGPHWPIVGSQVETCRKYWWSVLLHVQNYVNPSEICLGQSWYLSVDIQLYVVSPLVLFWLFGRKRIAWSALGVAILLSLISAASFVFVYNFAGSIVSMSRIGEIMTYMKKYYFNTLTRAPPFAVGLAWGYQLHVTRGRKIHIPSYLVAACWILAILMMALAIFPVHHMTQLDYSNQGFDNFFNTFVRAIWACGLGWIIFACVHGYGGPVNWFLSLGVWKLPARLSYAVYLVHYPVILVANGSWVDPHFFSPLETIYRFCSDLSLTLAASLLLCIIIDAPASTLQKMLFGGRRREDTKNKQPNIETANS